MPYEDDDDYEAPCHNCNTGTGIIARTWEDIEECPEAYNYVENFPETPKTKGIKTRYFPGQDFGVNMVARRKEVFYCENCLAVWTYGT